MNRPLRFGLTVADREHVAGAFRAVGRAIGSGQVALPRSVHPADGFSSIPLCLSETTELGRANGRLAALVEEL